MTDTQETNEFDRVKYLENLLKISQEINEELKATYKKQRNKRIDQLQKENSELKEQIEVKKLEILELKAQNEKMKNFIFEEFDICFYCPLTDTCINDEGTCPYANITEEEQKNLLSEWITK